MMNNKQTILDISWPISPAMTSYKDSKPITFTQHKNFPADQVRDSSISLNNHTGTHIDAPAHFLEHGKTIEAVPLNSLFGTCRVLDLTHIKNNISAADLAPHQPNNDEILLLKTSNSLLPPHGPFKKEFVYLDKTAAQFLAECKVRTVGIDYLGIEREQPKHETHCILFENNITIIEGLRLAEAQGEKTYLLSCLPIAIHGLEAAPARAVLIENCG